MILSSCGLFTLASLRRKRPHEEKLLFALVSKITIKLSLKFLVLNLLCVEREREGGQGKRGRMREKAREKGGRERRRGRGREGGREREND